MSSILFTPSQQYFRPPNLHLGPVSVQKSQEVVAKQKAEKPKPEAIEAPGQARPKVVKLSKAQAKEALRKAVATWLQIGF